MGLDGITILSLAKYMAQLYEGSVIPGSIIIIGNRLFNAVSVVILHRSHREEAGVRMFG